MEFALTLQELPAHKFAVLGVGLAVVLIFLLKLGWSLLMKAVMLAVFVALAAFFLLGVNW